MSALTRWRAGYLEAVVCTIVWGTMGPIVRSVDLPATTIAFYRLLFGFVVVLAWLAARGTLSEARPGRRPVLLAGSGLLLGVGWSLMFVGFQRIGVDTTILIMFCAPVLWVAAAPWVLNERLQPVTVAALLVALGGLALISLPGIGRLDPVGLLAAVAGAFLFATVILFGKLLTEHYTGSTIVIWQLGTALVLLSPAAAAPVDELLRGLPWLVLIGAVHTGVLGIVFFRAIRALQAQQLGVLYYLEPAAAIVFAWWWLGERPAPTTLLGGVLIVLAGVTLIRAGRSRASEGVPEPISAPIVAS